MNRHWAEFYARERTQDFLREAADARLAAAARQPRVGVPARRGERATPGKRAAKVVGRLLHFLRRATA
jgi:hypothetical protein